MVDVSPALDVPSFKLNGRRFGVEIEFVGARPSNVQDALRSRGVTFGSPYSYRDWEMHGESLGCYPDEGELCSPPLSGSDGAKQITLATGTMKSLGATTNHNCGLHVHHEVTEENLGVKGVILATENYLNCSHAIEALVAPRRRDWHYCHRLYGGYLDHIEGARTWSELRTAVQRCGRRAFSVHSIYSKSTIEIRQRQGSVDAHEILSWVAFGQAFLETARAGVSLKTRNPDKLLETLVDNGGLDDAAARFLAAQARVPVAA